MVQTSPAKPGVSHTEKHLPIWCTFYFDARLLQRRLRTTVLHIGLTMYYSFAPTKALCVDRHGFTLDEAQKLLQYYHSAGIQVLIRYRYFWSHSKKIEEADLMG